MEAKLGREILDRLDELPREHKWTRDELNELKQYYKRKLNNLRAGIPPEPPSELQLSFVPGGGETTA